MKYIKLMFVMALISPLASATTIIAGGGTNGFQFGYSFIGDDSFNHFTTTGDDIAAIRVGAFGTDGAFSQFAVSDSTPPVLGDSGPLMGRWLGNASDNSGAANEFATLVIWFEVTANVDGVDYTGYFTNGATFPVNGGGVGDTLTVGSNTLNRIGEQSSGDWTIDTSSGRIILSVIPEPSTALLGAIGALGLLRRRR